MAGIAGAAEVWDALSHVSDPEYPLSIVDMGLVYGVSVDPYGVAQVDITFTSIGCPAMDMICGDVPHWWFVSGDPRDEDPETNYFELPVQRDPMYESILMHKVDRFLGGYLAGETFKPVTYDRSTYEEIFG